MEHVPQTRPQGLKAYSRYSGPSIKCCLIPFSSPFFSTEKKVLFYVGYKTALEKTHYNDYALMNGNHDMHVCA